MLSGGSHGSRTGSVRRPFRQTRCHFWLCPPDLGTPLWWGHISLTRGLGPHHVEYRELAASHFTGAIVWPGRLAGHYLCTAMSSFLCFSERHLSECLPLLPCAYSGSLTPCVPMFRFPCPPYFHIPLSEIGRGNSLSVVSKHFFHFLTWTLNSTFLLKIPSTSLPVTLILRTCIRSFPIL